MIIRGKPNRDFTTIGNALFRDERLAADEVGIMGYLLSLPGDWEVRRPALMRRWKYGRDGIRRVMTNLIRTGWCEVEKTRLSDGRFNIVYIIQGAPGPELTEDEVKRALSLVSSEAADDDSADSSASDALETPEVCISPHTCQPGVADRMAAGRRWPIEGLLNTDDSNTDSTQAPWSVVRKAWPVGHMVSPFVCEKLFAELTSESKQAAYRGIVHYLADCRIKNRKICDLSTYLKEKRWEGRPTDSGTACPITGGTPQAFRWLEYCREQGQPTGHMEERWRNGKPWYARSEWPPARGSDDRMGNRQRGDPSPESNADISELAKEMGG